MTLWHPQPRAIVQPPEDEAYLQTDAGSVSTPDPGPLPIKCVFAIKLRGPAETLTLAAQHENSTTDKAWALNRRLDNGNLQYYMYYLGTGTYVATQGAIPAITFDDETIGIAIDHASDAGVNTRVWGYLWNGTYWANQGTNIVATTVPPSPRDSSLPLRVGRAHATQDVSPCRIYWMELRTGLDPSGNTPDGATINFPTPTLGSYMQLTKDPADPLTQVTGDLEIVCRVMQYDPAEQVSRAYAAKHASTTNNQRAWQLSYYNARYRFNFATAAAPSTWVSHQPNVGQVRDTWDWLKVQRDMTTGMVNMFVAPDAPEEPTTGWTLLSGSGIIQATGPLAETTVAAVEIGSRNNGSADNLSGRVSRFIMRNGIGVTGLQLIFPGVIGSYLSAPDNVAQRIVGDIEFVCRLQPASNGVVIAKFNINAGGRGYQLGFNNDYPRITVSTTGGDFPFGQPTVKTTPGAMIWLKATRVAATGVLQFFTAPDSPTEPTTWTQMGADTTMQVGNINPATPPMEVGSNNGGSAGYLGRIARTIVRNGIGATTPRIKFPNVAYNYLTTPDEPVQRISGDIEFVFRALLGTTFDVHRWEATGGNRSWQVHGISSNRIRLTASFDGLTSAGYAQSGTFTYPQVMEWYKITRNAVTGETLFYRAPDSPTEPTTWTPFTTGTTLAAGNLHPAACAMEIGGGGGGGFTDSRLARWIVRNGIGATTTQLVFPGVVSNYLSIPGQWATGGDTQSIEVIVRCSQQWATPATGVTGGYQGVVMNGNRFGIRRAEASSIQFYSYAADGSLLNAGNPVPASWVNGQMVWLRGTRSGGFVTWQWALDTADGSIPTTWIDFRPPSAVTAGVAGGAATVSIGADAANGATRPWEGRIARVIVRDVIGGPNVIDIKETDAKVGASTFTATAGGTVTVYQTVPSKPIVRGTVFDMDEALVPDATVPTFPARTGQTITVMRSGNNPLQGTVFDMNEAAVPSVSAASFPATVGGTVTVVKAGNHGAIIRGTVLDIDERDIPTHPVTSFLAKTGQQVNVYGDPLDPIPSKLLWRFDARDARPGQTTWTDPRGRVWTIDNPQAIVPAAIKPHATVAVRASAPKATVTVPPNVPKATATPVGGPRATVAQIAGLVASPR